MQMFKTIFGAIAAVFATMSALAANVAKIGEVEYATFAEAVVAAADGDTITFIADETEPEATISQKKLSIDLGGYTLTDSYIIVSSSADVLLKNGKIVNVAEPYPLVVQNGGKLTVENVDIEASKSDRAIWVRSSNSSLVFNSGSILATKGEGNSKTSLIAAIYTDKNTDVIINGGTITVDTPDNKAVGIYGNYENANVTVNGGKISTNGKNYSYGINVDGDITVTGGEIVTNEKGYGYSSGIHYGYNYALCTALGDVTVSGGKIVTTGHSGYIANVGRTYSSNDQTITITGGEFDNILSEADKAGGHSAPAFINEGSASSVTVAMSGGSVEGFSGNLVKGDSTSLSISGGSFDVAPKADYIADDAVIVVAGNVLTKDDSGLVEVGELTLSQFVALVASGNGSFDGAVTVKITPISGDARTETAEGLPNRLQKYSNPEVYYAQYQRFADLTDVTIKNVKFVFVPAAVTVKDPWNTSGATTTDANINGELQFMNKGVVTLETCTFEKMSVSPINATSLSVAGCAFTGLDAYAIKDITASTVSVTGTTFTDCNGGFWMNAAPTTLTVTGNKFENVGRRGAIQFSASGDYTSTSMTVTGNTVTGGAFLWQLNFTVTYDQVAAILDTTKNTYDTAYVSGSTEPPAPVAKIGETGYASLQSAIDAAVDGDTVVLVADCAENVTVVQAADKKITIDGNEKTMSGSVTVDGKSAAYETAGLTIKNVKFNATGIAMDACINLGNGTTTTTRYVSNVTVEDCTFTGGGRDKAAIKSYTGGDKNLVVKGCTVDDTMHSLLQADNIAGVVVDDCTVQSKNGINLNSSSDVEIMNSTIEVNGYAVRAGVSGGTSGAVTLTGNTLKTNNSEGDAVIIIRGTASTLVDLAMSGNVVSGETHIAGTTSATKISADANYWDGKMAPVVDGAAVSVDTYYMDSSLATLKTTPKGNKPVAYVANENGVVKVWGETWGNASESYALKLYSGEKLVATTVLNNIGGIINGNVNVTWNFYYPASDDEYWTTTWEDDQPNSKDIPNRIALVIDGVEVNSGDVQMNGPDSLKPVVWRKLGGVKIADLEGEGTVESPFLIETIDELKWFRDDVNAGNTYAGKHVKLTADIDLANQEWEPIGVFTDNSNSVDDKPFKGVFDGQNKTISNLKINKPEVNAVGFFAYAISATIKNINVCNVDITGYSQVATIAGRPYSGCVISDCHVSGMINITAKYAYAGGIAGYGYLTVLDCSVVGPDTKGAITAEKRNAVGGITAWLLEDGSKLTNCHVKNMSLTGWSNVGGLTGFLHRDGVIDGCSVVNVDLTKTREDGHPGVGLAAGGWSYNASKPATVKNSTFKNVTRNGQAIYFSSADVIFGSEYAGNVNQSITTEDNNTFESVEDNLWLIVSTYEDLVSALARTDAKVRLANDITATATQSSGYGKAGVVLNAGNILDGDGKTLTIDGANATWDCVIAMKGGEVRDLTIAGAMRGVFMPGANGDVVIDNCKFKDVIYTFNSDAGSKDYSVTIRNTALNGWTSFSAAHKSVTFETCSFGEGSGYAYCRPYQATEFKDCSFAEGYAFDATKTAANTLSFDECTYAGESLNSENGELLFGFGGQVLVAGTSINFSAVARIGETRYDTLESAFKAATSGCTIEILADVTVDYDWDCRNTGSKFTVPVTINGNGHTIKFTGKVFDGYNHLCAFRFEDAATVRDLTIDMGAAVSGWGARLRAISAKGDLTVEDCVFIGNADYASTRAIIFGEGSGQAISDVEVSVIGSRFVNWARGIGDNENGQDAKSVKIEDSDFDNANVIISASESVVFNDNAMDGCWVRIESYSDVNGLAVTASGNDLEANTATDYNYVDAATIVVQSDFLQPVAMVGNKKYADLQSALNAAVAGTGNVTVDILVDIDMSGKAWTPVTVSAPGYPFVTVNGNNKTITGLSDMLFAGTWAGKSGLVIKDLTIADSTIVNDENDSKGTVGVGAFVGYPQASETITLENCHLKNSTVKGGHWTGGLVGMAGGYNGSDGPVFMTLTIEGCSVTDSTITGKGSAGGIIGHGSCSAWTDVVIKDTVVSGNTITSTGSSANKAGSVMGTIGAAGQSTTVNGVTKTGGMSVSVTTSGNTVKSADAVITTIYGRQGTATGMLEIAGGSYEANPIEEGVAYAAPIYGYKIDANDDGTYGLKTALAGEGTKDSPYVIYTANDLIYFRDYVNSGKDMFNASGVWIALGADIDLVGINWTPIGVITQDHGFMGNFDGNGFKITNLTIDNPALDSDGYAYAGLFGITEGTDKDNQNIIKNLTIENVTINTTGHIVSAAIAYPYYTIVENIKVCGNINIKGGDYTAGVLAYTRRCVDAKDIYVVGNAGSAVAGKKTVGGVISDIQMNGGLTANYSNFNASGLTISGEMHVGGISGIMSVSEFATCSVKDVVLVCSDNRVGIVSGSLGMTATVSGVTIENVTGAERVIGASYKDGVPVEAKVGDTYYADFQDAFNALKSGDTLTLLADVVGDVTIEQAPDTVITIDGNDKTMFGSITVDGKSAAYATAGLTITNLNFDATGISTEACINFGISGNNNTRYVSNVTVEDCTFTGGGRVKVAIKSYTGGDKNLTITRCIVDSTMHSLLQADNIAGVVVDDCTVQSKNGINLNSSSDVEIKNSTIEVNGYAVRAGVSSGGDSGAITLTSNTLKTDNSEGDAVIVIRGAAATDANITMTKNLVEGNTHISGTTEATVINADANYWGEGLKSPVVSGAAIVVTTYYKDSALTDLHYSDPMAVIGAKDYASLADAIAAVKDGETITLVKDCAETVTIAQKANHKFTIDGNDKTYTGMMTVNNGKGKTSASLLIKNLNFVSSVDGRIIITVNEVNNLTIDGCSFKGIGTGYGIKLADADNKNIVVKNTTGSNLYELVYANKAVNGFTAENVTASDVAYGFFISYGINLNFTNVKVSATDCGIAVNNHNASEATFTDCELTAECPVYLQAAKDGNGVFRNNAFTLMFNGENALASTTGGDLIYVESSPATFKAIVNDADLDMTKASAFVAKVDNTYYTKLQKAFEAAKDGDTVMLARDITFTTESALCDVSGVSVKSLLLVKDKAVTLDLNEKTISVDYQLTTGNHIAVITVEDAASLTVTGNGTIEATASTESATKLAYLFWKRGTTGTLVIKNGTYHVNDAADSIIYTNGDEIVAVEGGTFILDEYGANGNGFPCILNAQGNAERQITVLGGKFNADIAHQSSNPIEVLLPANKAITQVGDMWEVLDSVAYVHENLAYGSKYVGYATFAEAFAAANKYGNITLLDDVVLADGATLALNEGMTVDLNGKTLTAGAVEFAADVTVSNGTLDASTVEVTAAGKTVTLTDVALTGEIANAGVATTVVVNSDALADKFANVGYHVVNNGDGTYTASFERSVAKVGDVIYSELSDAINAAKAGGTVTVVEDIVLTETVKVPADASVTLELNGKTVSMEMAETVTANHAMIINDGNLIIQDAVGGGKLSYKYTGGNLGTSYAANTLTSNPGSVLTVKSGTVENLTYDSATIAYAIDGLTNGGMGDVAVNIEGGTITSMRQSIRIFANSTTKTGALNISGGAITGRVIVQNANTSANKAALEITGGTFNANAYKEEVLSVGGSNGATIDMAPVVTGGVFNGKIISTVSEGFIFGGVFSTDVTEFCAEDHGCSQTADGMYAVKPAGNVVYIDPNGNKTFRDTLMQTADGFKVKLLADVVMTKDVVMVRNDGDDVTLDLNGKTLTNDYKLSSKGTLVILANGGEVVGNGSIEPDGTEPFGEVAPAVIADKSVAVNCPAGAVQIDIDGDRTFTSFVLATVDGQNYFDIREAVTAAKTSGKELVLMADVELDDALVVAVGESLSIALGDNILSGDVSNGALIVNEGELSLTGGKVDNTDTGREVVDVENKNIISVNGTEANVVDKSSVAVIEKVNGAKVSCQTLADAVGYASEGDTVKLLKSVEIDSLIKLERAITLDLGGNAVNATSKKAFEVHADATIRNGSITAANRCVDTRKAVALTMETLKLTADNYSTSYGNPQPLTIGGSDSGTTVAMTGVEISAKAGYGIITFVETSLLATNCTISGYNTLYVKPGSENSRFEFVDCDLTGDNTDNDVPGNSFSTIAVRANNVDVIVDANSTVTAKGVNYRALSLDGDAGEGTVTGVEVCIEGEISGNILSCTEPNGNVIAVKADYTDALEAEGFAVEEFTDDGSMVKVIGEKVAELNGVAYASFETAFAAARDGDEIIIVKAGTYAVPAGKNIAITGGVDGVVFDNIGAKNMGGASITFNNVTFDYYPNVNYTGLQHSGDLVYNNCTFNGQVFLYGASETFNKCTFNQNSADAYNVWTYDADPVVFNDCTFNSVGKSVLIYHEGASVQNNVTVTDCDFIASAPVAGKAAIEMDSSLTAGINLTIDAATTATGFDNGNVSGNSLWNNKKGNNTEKNNDITVIVDDVTVLEPLVFVAKIGEICYTSVTEAINAAQDGDTIDLYSGTYDEKVAPWAADSTHKLEKSITIAGAPDFGTTLTGGLYLGYDDSQCREHTITIKGIAFEGKGVLVASQKNVIIVGNKFSNITEPVASTGSATENAISVIGKNVNATIVDNEIDTVASVGIMLRNINTAVVTGNTVVNTQHNAIQITTQTGSAALADSAVVVENNILSDWGLGGEGRAMRIAGGSVVEVNENVMTHADAPEQFVKVTGVTTIDASGNYWNGRNPCEFDAWDFDKDTDPALTLVSYYTDAEKTTLIPVDPAVAKIGDVYYRTLASALKAVADGGTITLCNVKVDESAQEIEFDRDIEFTVTGTAPDYMAPVITFQNATVTFNAAKLQMPELDARQNATINVVDSEIKDCGGNSIVKSYYNGAINISGSSVVYTMQLTTMGYITLSDTAKLHATWQSNIYGNGLIRIEGDAELATAAIHLTGQAYNDRDNTDTDRVGKPAAVVVDGATLTVGKVRSSNGADYSYNSTKGIDIGTVVDKSAVLDIKNGAKVEIYQAGGNAVEIGESGTLNVAGSELAVFVRGNGEVVVENKGSIAVDGDSYVALNDGVKMVVYGELTSAGDIAGDITSKDDAEIALSGGTYTQDVIGWCIEGYTSVANGDGTYTVSPLPESTLVEDGRGIILEDLVVPETVGVYIDEALLDVSVKFERTPASAQGVFADYLVDLYVTVTGLPSEGVVCGEDDYLAGDFGPAGKLFLSLEGKTLTNGMTIPVLSLAEKTLTYRDVCEYAGDFRCGIHLESTVEGLTVTFQAGLKNNDGVISPLGNALSFDLTYSGSVAILTDVNGEVYGPYYTLAEALEDAYDGDAITLLTDATEKVVIPDDREVMIDLNGNTLNGSILAPNADLVVMNGSIINADSSVSAIEINAGMLELENINIDSARHAVRIDGDVVAVIDGGIYKVNPVSGMTLHAVNISGVADVTIDGGTFVGPMGTVADSGAAVNVQSGSTVTINGGSFQGGKNNTLSAKGDLTVSGGTFNQDPVAYLPAGYESYTAGSVYGVMKRIALDITMEDGKPFLGYGESETGTLVIKATATLDGTVTWTTITWTKDEAFSASDTVKDWVAPEEGFRFFKAGMAE